MLLEQNVVPFTQLIQDNPPLDSNLAPITVPNTQRTICTVNLNRLTVGAIFIVTFRLAMLKGGVAGRNEVYVNFSPSAGIFDVDITFMEATDPLPAATYYVITRTYVCKILDTDSTDGTVTLTALSVGSDSDVAIGEGQLSVIQLWG